MAMARQCLIGVWLSMSVTMKTTERTLVILAANEERDKVQWHWKITIVTRQQFL